MAPPGPVTFGEEVQKKIKSQGKESTKLSRVISKEHPKGHIPAWIRMDVKKKVFKRGANRGE